MTRFDLPEVDFIEVDTEELENIAVSKFEQLQGVVLAESDPRRKMIQAVAYIGALISNSIDYTGKQSLLAYANDNFLDHIGAKKGVPRLKPTPAATTIRFDVNNPENFIIPGGTRLTVNELFFATEADMPVPTGVNFIDIKAYCQEPGTIGNGYLPGQITEIVDTDNTKWVSKAYNITKTEGGTDWEADDPYAERIRMANEKYSTAGPELAYVYYAKSANQKVIDVKILSNSPGVVEIIPLMEGGNLPTDLEKKEILEICSDRSIRPLTDQVIVKDPVIHTYNLEITYYLSKELEQVQAATKANVQKAVDEYILWQKSELGRGIDSSELYPRLQNVGAKRISINPSQFVALNKNEVAREGTVTVTFGGFIGD